MCNINYTINYENDIIICVSLNTPSFRSTGELYYIVGGSKYSNELIRDNTVNGYMRLLGHRHDRESVTPEFQVVVWRDHVYRTYAKKAHFNRCDKPVQKYNNNY